MTIFMSFLPVCSLCSLYYCGKTKMDYMVIKNITNNHITDLNIFVNEL